MQDKIQFAVVREDPVLEKRIIEERNISKVLMVASAGCTALSLKNIFPEVNFTLFDLNQRQIDLVKHKIKALEEWDDPTFKEIYNIGVDSRSSLNGCGQFESLFRSFRNFLNEFVLSADNMKKLFGEKDEKVVDKLKISLFTNRYWPVAFDLFFSDSLLVTMFGPDAIQHAVPGSYPRYFQKQLEKGFNDPYFQTNYFLHHIFLGYYLDQPDCWPLYLHQRKNGINFDFIKAPLMEIPHMESFQLVDLSNIFDWMAEKEVEQNLLHLRDILKPGSIILFRQLNNEKKYIDRIEGLVSHDQWAQELMAEDRSLFYNKVNIIERI